VVVGVVTIETLHLFVARPNCPLKQSRRVLLARNPTFQRNLAQRALRYQHRRCACSIRRRRTNAYDVIPKLRLNARVKWLMLSLTTSLRLVTLMRVAKLVLRNRMSAG
jgi:hypothetical protein